MYLTSRPCLQEISMLLSCLLNPFNPMLLGQQYRCLGDVQRQRQCFFQVTKHYIYVPHRLQKVVAGEDGGREK